jgi:Putative restriction endonuclease
MNSITFQPLERLTPAQLLEFSQLNHGLQCEMNTNGSIILKTPFKKKYITITDKILHSLNEWLPDEEEFVILDNKIGYVLSNSAVRHPIISVIKRHKLTNQLEHLIESVPDFALEYLTETENFTSMKLRMREYITNGCHLAWLLDLNNEKVYIYKMDGSETVVENFENTLEGDKILRGYVLNLAQL